MNSLYRTSLNGSGPSISVDLCSAILDGETHTTAKNRGRSPCKHERQRVISTGVSAFGRAILDESLGNRE